jgi:cell division protein FtsZ
MDELAEITDYISEMAGDEAEVIFGHGIDEDLDESIRVTVIATGFDHQGETIQIKKSKVIDLESNKTVKETEPKSEAIEQENQKQSGSQQPGLFDNVRTYTFENPSKPEEEEDEMSKLSIGLDENVLDKIGENQDQQSTISNELNENHLNSKRVALQQQARDRIEKLKDLKNTNHDREEDYKDKWDTPAYVRRNVNLQDVPHSSEKNISRYNLNDDNQILGNNKFLHDNVD